MPHIPSFDDSIVALLRLLGVGGSVLALVTLAFSVASWYGGLKRSYAAAVAGRQIAQRVASRFVTGRGRAFTAGFVTVAVLAAQVLATAGWYVVGNVVSVLVNAEDARAVQVERELAGALEGSTGYTTALWLIPVVVEHHRFDRISGGFTLVALLLLARAYILTTRGRPDRSIYGAERLFQKKLTTFLFCLPVVLGALFPITISVVAALAVILGLLGLLLAACGINDFESSGPGELVKDALTAWLVPSLPWTALGIIYTLLCVRAIQGSWLMRDVWERATANRPS